MKGREKRQPIDRGSVVLCLFGFELEELVVRLDLLKQSPLTRSHFSLKRRRRKEHRQII